MKQATPSKSKATLLATFVVRKAWMLFAIFIVFIALFMSFLRYSLPLLNDQKDFFENYLSEQYKIDIDIGELAASWRNNGPSVVLQNIHISRNKASPISLEASEILIEIDFWPSIANWNIQSSKVVLNQLTLEFDSRQMKSTDSDFPIVEAIENIFLEQLSNFSIVNSRFKVITENQIHNVEIVDLFWINDGNHHQGMGNLSTQGLSKNTANFIVDLHGDVNSYNGTLYAQAQDIELSTWLNQYASTKDKLLSSSANIEVWGQIANSKLIRIDGKLMPSTLIWQNDDYRLSNTISASFSAQSNKQRWDFSIADVLMGLNEQELQVNFNGYYAPQQGFHLSLAESLQLEKLLPFSRVYSTKLADKLAFVDLQARLDTLDILLDNKGLSAYAGVGNIAWQEHLKLAGVDQLSAELFWQGNKGKLLVNGEQANIFSTHYFDRNLDLASLYLPIEIRLQDSLLITSKQSHAVIDGIDLDFNFAYSSLDDFLSIALVVDSFDINKVPSLLPSHLLGPNTKNFLVRAFQGDGKVQSAEILWHGKTHDFPFDNEEGVFQSKVALSNAEFVFSRDWPSLRQANIDLLFENDALYMSAETAELKDVLLSNLQANILPLGNGALLTISADAQGTSKNLIDIVAATSLANTLGKVLENEIQIEGALSSALSLSIPLSDIEAIQVKGNAKLAGNEVYIPSVNLNLDGAVGSINYDNAKISIDGLQARLWEQDIVLHAEGDYIQKQYLTQLELSGNWDASIASELINAELKDYFEGDFTFNSQVNLVFEANKFNYDASLYTSLEGTALSLPLPFSKQADDIRAVEVIASGDLLASQVEVRLADLAVFNGALAHKEKKFNRAHLALGPTDFDVRGLGFSISADFESLDVDAWYPFVKAISSENESGQDSLLGLPQRIFINSQKLHFSEHAFNDVDIVVKRLENQWEIDLDANELRGNVNIHDDSYSRGIVADFEYIHFVRNLDAQSDFSETNINPKLLPSLKLSCKSCKIDDYNLGRVELEAAPNNDGMQINRLLLDNGSGLVNTSGQWYKRNDDHFTFIGGELNSSDFGAFLKHFNFDSGIQDSGARMSFALTWQGGPSDFDLAQLDGEMDWSLSDGYLTELSDKGSRLFSILSLNSLIRKLSLDFRDVFAKGFFYDNMQGTMQITQGKADTRDTVIDGAAGEIEIYGYTDLATKELNYNVSYAPNVTGNLPFLVYFFTVSPPTALAALAIDQVLTSAKVISNVNYSVTGSIDKPILIETGRESTEVELPARRNTLPKDDTLPPFVPPSKEDLIEIEVKEDQT